MRDSTLGWLGLIPEAWELKPFFTVCSELNNKNKGMKESNLLSLSYGNIVLKDIDSNEGLLPESFEGYQIVEPDDLVFRFTDLQNDQRSLRSAISQHSGIITSAYLAVRPVDAIPKFLAYLMRAYDQLKVFYSMGGGLRQAMNFQDVKRLPLPIPPLDEQQVIVDFLDRETAQIDELITKQQQLVQALKEKIQAQIKHAVTGGRQNNVTGWRKTESWAGIIPDHWGLSKLKYLAFIQQGYSFSAGLFEDEGPLPVVKQSDFFLDEFTTYTSEVVPKRFLVEDGDVLISMSGDFNCKLWERGIAGLNQRCASIRSDNYQVSNLWLSYVLPAALADLSTTNVSTTVSNMSSSELANLLLPSPPISEQIEITAYLDREVSKTETLSSNALEMVQLLNERRQALISAAVSGKIDVRGK